MNNNWSCHLLAIQRAVNTMQHYASAGKFTLAIAAIRSIEASVLRSVLAMEAEQERRAELEKSNND